MPRRRQLHLTLAGFMICAATGHGAETNQVSSPIRPASWAQKIDVPGVKNCHVVTTNLYRGAQPTAEGMAQLKARGIKTVINLRALHSDKNEVAGTGLKSVRFHTEPWHGEMEDVIEFLKIVANTNNLPVFVHCQRGADRTGMMCAMYRITACGWTKAAAIDEMKNGGFGFYPRWENLVELIEKADVENLKKQAGLSPTEKKSEHP